MRWAKHSDGSTIFKKDDFLTPQQIAGFFSRLTAKKTYDTERAANDDVEIHEANTEKDIQELTKKVRNTFTLQHSIMFDKYNVCEIVCQSQLTKLTIATLWEICTALEIDVSPVWKCKQPYIDRLIELVDRCSCRSK